MDFPKGVEGIGLVAGRFIDENPVTGQQGSLIAAAWGNQVTDEIINVLTAAKLTPSEQESDQLLKAIKSIITANMPTSLSDWKDIDNKPLAISALTNIVTVNTTSTLTNEQLGLILIDASASDVALTLPQSAEANKAVRVTLFRLDNSTHKVTIKSATGETIYFNTKLNANGYGFFYLMGAGDYWQLMSNGAKGWYNLARKDSSPLGRVSFDTVTEAAEGGYLVANGTLLNRTDYPWLWDYAQKSGLLVEDAARTGYEGCFTKGDGTTTFRIPDLRAMLLRALDNGRGIDTDRIAGTYQEDAFKEHTHTVYTQRVGLYGSLTAAWDIFPDGGQGTNPKVSTKAGGTETRPKNIAYPLYIKII